LSRTPTALILTPAACSLHKSSIVKGDLCFPDKSQIAREILAYLADHPDAEDTLDGIVQWWLLERKIKYQKSLVQEAIADLVDQKLILTWNDSSSRRRYRANNEKAESLQKILDDRDERT
jgi:hypothetical protein